ncbi:hypothetical protein CFHF_04100 [Caulobacter flavus]|uniref:ATP-binding protein n=1 Tax=Caulobacter flavus TaxID=1679497 RepID=A0A2N5CZF6_9CAUL|nr:ATP-binding protein [Caulobacter flavus]AYV45121.1 hypothetical protein C1707_02070 [Caulobacter flavus]PLR19199.1 hypothetical protein CFHF_04100 [Caulobacter flavus]
MQQLEFKPRARIIRTVGDQLISGPEAAIIELARNAYDADASYVIVEFTPPSASAGWRINIIDDGHGMSLADIRIRRLLVRWGDLESDVVQNHNWFGISRREQLELPQGREMARIDKMLTGLFRERQKLLEALPRTAATDPTGVAAKIAAAVKAIDPDDHQEVHFLLSGAARDLAAMRCPGCHQPLVTEAWIDWSTRVDQGGKVSEGG